MTPQAHSAVLFALLFAATPAEGETLGRLFFTPQERAALDRQRQQGIQAGEASAQIINGIVSPSRGKATVWVNGVRQTSDNVPADWRKKALGGSRLDIKLKTPER